MHIDQPNDILPLVTPAPYQYIGRDGVCRDESEAVLEECAIEVRVHGRQTLELICTPQFLPELILGRLLTEGFIRTAEDVKRISIHPSVQEAEVWLKDGLPDRLPLSPVVPIPWSAAHVFTLADRFADGMPLHEKTWATHSCFLAQGGEPLFACEDIGRHNALDKALGHALLHDIRLSQCTVYSSGRVPTDMAMKAIRAGVPVMASKASPTRKAVALAEKYHLTLICAARRDRMKLFMGIPPSQ